MSEVGLRKGRKRGINTVALISGKENCKAELREIYGNSIIGEIYSKALLNFRENEKIYIAIFPNEDGNSILKEISEEKGKIEVHFEAAEKNKELRAKLYFDNRGRAKNLEKGKKYSFKIFRKHEFFRGYEIRSMPSGKKGKSEPEELGLNRIRVFMEFLYEENLENKIVCDFATGIKNYLKLVMQKNARIISMNISDNILKRVKTWLDNKSGRAFFIVYDADRAIPIKDKALDMAICDALLEYIENPFSFIERISRKIKKGGNLLLLEPIKALQLKEDFYPQDMFEFAIYRALKDDDFKRERIEEKLNMLGFELSKRKKIKFSYHIYGKEEFEQKIGCFKRVM